MKLVQIYRCLCDETRLRVLNLLRDGELCVCHIQACLDEPQVKISKHLAYLRANRLVEVRRSANWMIYSLPTHPSKELAANLACLQDCAQESPVFRTDSRRLKKLKASADCCPPSATPRKPAVHSKT
jgi:ArsR family transcriptional regulator, arsenate/arsenite/antimonite-responsive transcriptional repressor